MGIDRGLYQRIVRAYKTTYNKEPWLAFWHIQVPGDLCRNGGCLDLLLDAHNRNPVLLQNPAVIVSCQLHDGIDRTSLV